MSAIDNLFTIAANIVAATALIPLLLFVYYYGTRPIPGHKYRRRYSTMWRLTAIGRTLMYQKIAWVGFIVFILIQIFAGQYFGREELRLVIYGALVFFFWRLFYTLRITQKSGHTPDPDTESTPIVDLRPAKDPKESEPKGSADQEKGID